MGVWVRESCSRFTRAWIGRSAAGTCRAGSALLCRRSLSRVGAGLIDLLLRHERPRSGNVAWREPGGQAAHGLDPVLDTEGTLEQYRQLDAQVLLIYGSETDLMFVDCAEALHAVLPHSTVLRLPGLNHDSAQTYGKPGDDRCGAAAVLWATNDLTAKARVPGTAMELFAEPGTLAVGPERARVVQWLPASPTPGSRSDTYFPCVDTGFRHARPLGTGRRSGLSLVFRECGRASKSVSRYIAMSLKIRRRDPVGITRSRIGPIASWWLRRQSRNVMGMTAPNLHGEPVTEVPATKLFEPGGPGQNTMSWSSPAAARLPRRLGLLLAVALPSPRACSRPPWS